MTISQAGTGSGASGEAVRKIYNALYGVSADGAIDKKKALLATPQKSLPKIESDGSIDSPEVSKDPVKDLKANDALRDGTTDPGQDLPAGTTPSPTAANRDTRRRSARRGSRGEEGPDMTTAATNGLRI